MVLSLYYILTYSETLGFVLQTKETFQDVPREHWAANAIYELNSLKVTKGIEANIFGLGRIIKRDEFIGMLTNLIGFKSVTQVIPSFKDNQNKSRWYYSIMETALKNDVISLGNGSARPEEAITREEMAEMIVRSMGYQSIAEKMDLRGDGFSDVFEKKGYITLAKDFGIVAGLGANMFNPKGKASREEGAVMISKMYEKVKTPFKEINAFYASSSYKQVDRISDVSTTSFAWGDIKFDTRAGKPTFQVLYPKGFEGPLKKADGNANLSVLLSEEVVSLANGEKTTLATQIIRDKAQRDDVINKIIQELNKSKDELKGASFGGVVIDFEGMKGNELKENFIQFLKELKVKLAASQKKLYVAVHPKVLQWSVYYDAYDYRSIGEFADKIILMAHDYSPKILSDTDMQNGFVITPLAPGYEVYYALKMITDSNSGVVDRSKILLQISFSSIQWKLKGGVVINKNPYTPDYSRIRSRLEKVDTQIFYSKEYHEIYAKFHDSSDGTDNVLWYEDTRSVMDKVKLAKLFGIGGISLWRLGEIPDENGKPERNFYFNTFESILKVK